MITPEFDLYLPMKLNSIVWCMLRDQSFIPCIVLRDLFQRKNSLMIIDQWNKSLSIQHSFIAQISATVLRVFVTCL